MLHTIKKVIDAEFAANEIEVSCRVNTHIEQFGKPQTYRIQFMYRGGLVIMDAYCNAQRPFVPKLKPINPIEPHKLIKLCEIVQEAFKELERKSEEGEGQFR